MKDAFGKAIESATVTVVGTNLSTSTDIDGFYKLKIDSKQNLKIEVTSVGYITQNVSLKSNETYKDFQLKKDDHMLEIVNVKGQTGNQKKSQRNKKIRIQCECC
ncbi:carboxypeptidase-like regulatory domain-containing protein [Sphingobacterium sp. E70]|uniref:carboxypeptidase-like regulatory domain-containing protein n=1 Tax=Sphingobacterium sp. E70 TaxID=2853439 RepID=UPI00211CB233|nr:carboxypeptidase-like regulatory domain-containing protein [Sphingobacterium sp. E70]ULT27288.1 carboxypeptidase-like regulatory domain-containing protein [Sphingobacterium sp. E70]